MITSDLSPQQCEQRNPRAARGYVLVLACALALYWITAQRGVAWQDSGVHQLRALRSEYANSWGLALAHPLYIAICQPFKVFGLTNLATCTSLLSGVAMAVTLANVYLLGYWLTKRHAAAALAAATLGISHTAWWLATISETYCWVTAGLSAELLLLVSLIARPRWWKLVLLGLVSGLGFSLHNLALLPLPVHAVTALLLVGKKRLGWPIIPAALAAWLVGAGLQLSLIVQHGLAHGDWPATIRSALFGHQWQENVMSTSLRAMSMSGLYVLLNWPFLSLAPVIVGWWVMSRYAGKAIASALGGVAAIELIFAVRYSVVDQFMFLLPSYTLLAVGSAVGIDRLCRARGRARRVWLGLIVASLTLTPVLYSALPAALNRTSRSIRPNRQWPYRDENRYWLTPWKSNEQSAATFAREALDVAGPDGVILLSTTAAPPVMVLQEAGGLHPRVHIEAREQVTLGRYKDDPKAYRERLAGRPLYVVDGKPDVLPEGMRPHVRSRSAWPLVRLDFVDHEDGRQPSDVKEVTTSHAGGP